MGRAAALIAAITVAARAAGFGRLVVFTWAVGYAGLGAVYLTANTIPNIVFEVVAGGALASLVVPLLAAPLARSEPAAVSRIASALLTWTLTLLVPAAVLVAVLAEPIMRLLVNEGSPADIAVGANMLRVFAPQLPLYGIGIVLTGVLQAHRRFAWPALAPLLSSITVAGAYALYAVVGERGAATDTVSRQAELVLSVGTTVGVVVLAGCLFIPLRGLGLRLRPTFRFGAQAARSVRALAAAGAVTIAAQQLTLALVIRLANDGPSGTLVVFNVSHTLYLLPWGVLAVPLATSVYPVLAEAHSTGDEPGYARRLADSTRAVLLLSGLGAAALAGLARPLAVVLAAVAPTDETGRRAIVDALTDSVAGLAPGLIGYSLFALLSRALYARGATAVAARVTVASWAVVAAASVALSVALPDEDRALAIAVGNSVGVTVLGAALLVAVVRRAGTAAARGTMRTATVAVVAAALAAAAGSMVATVLPAEPSVGAALAVAAVGGVTVVVVYFGVSVAADGRDARPMAAAVWARMLRTLRR